MIEDATVELKKNGLDWKEDQMELISLGLNEEIEDFCLKKWRERLCDQKSGCA